jgi:hypothetical protein
MKLQVDKFRVSQDKTKIPIKYETKKTLNDNALFE